MRGLTCPHPYIAEISAGAGFDWLLIDGEHAPNDLRSIIAQLQVIAASASHPVVRPVIGETWMIKQLLDAGAQSLLVPMVESAAQARELVRVVLNREGARAESLTRKHARAARRNVTFLLSGEAARRKGVVPFAIVSG